MHTPFYTTNTFNPGSLSRAELEAGYSKRVAAFKREGVDCVTLDYQEYTRLVEYAAIGLAISRLEQDDLETLTLAELKDELSRA